MISRRIFLVSIPVSALALRLGTAFAAVDLAESDPAAAALGYKVDASKVDGKKYPSYASGRICAGCQLYAGNPTDPAAPCNIFAGKLVSGKGWCAAWAKKA